MYKFNAHITRVVDGDTADAVIDVGFNLTTTQRLRFLGINTPETRGESREAGLVAKEKVKELIEGKDVVVQTYRSDVFGRYLATIYYNGTNINTWLLENGYAVEYEG